MKKVTPTEEQGPLNAVKNPDTGEWSICYPGDVFETSDERADKLVKSGKAKLIDPSPEEDGGESEPIDPSPEEDGGESEPIDPSPEEDGGN